MQKLLIILFLCFGTLGFKNTKITKDKEWTISSSTIKFKIKNGGFNVDGTFTGLAANIIFDKDKNYGNSIDASIEVKTISTGISARDRHLKKEEYFDAEKYPKITIKSSFLSKLADGTYKGIFKLTIKDKTKEVNIPFTYTETNDKGKFLGSFTINRLDYGVGTSGFIMSDKVTILIELNTILK